MKKNNIAKEYNLIKEKINLNKDKSIKEFEEFKKKIIFSLDSHLDILYKKRDYISEVFSKKKELKKSKISVWKKFIRTKFWINLKYLFSMPFIYMMIIPGLIMHITVEIYHQVCFRIYGIPLVKAKEYFIFDRKNLPYLNWLEKINCFYCSYYNCLVSYLQEIVGRTERFWCPIKHAKRMPNTHLHYETFVDYSDAESLRLNWNELRKFKELKK